MHLRYFSYLTLVLSTFTITVGAEPSEIQFDRDIRPILADKCFFCHGPDKEHQEADLRLDMEDEALAVIKPGSPDESDLIARILATDE
ncbi:MAG: c-type cytochrome domain-containing protein, partial [Rubripirellula sp.]